MVFHFTHWVARQAEDIVSSQSVFRSWAKTVYLLNLLSMEPCYLPWSDIAPSAKMAKRFTELSQICGSGDEPDAEDEDAELSETYKAPIYYEEEPDESDGDDGPEIL
jgi:hypothetical protein